MKKRERWKVGGLSSGVWWFFLLMGCSLEKSDPEKIEDLEFTIGLEAEIPAEFLSLIEEKKQNPMTLSYLDGDAMYLAIGYGSQRSTGYSIGVESFYRTETDLCVDTTLIGPQPGESVTEKECFPYVVLRTDRREEPIRYR